MFRAVSAFLPLVVIAGCGGAETPAQSSSETSVSATYAESVREQWAGVDAQVRAISDPANPLDGETPRVDGGVVSAIAELPEVSYVDAGLFSFERAYTVDSNGELVVNVGIHPVFTGSWDGPGPLSAFELVDGEPPVGQQVAIDPEQAEQGGFVIGEEITISLPSGETEVFTLSGTAVLERAGTGGPGLILFDLPTTQRVLELPGLVDSILVAADGVSQQELVDAISSLLPDGVEALTGEAVIAEQLAQWQ